MQLLLLLLLLLHRDSQRPEPRSSSPGNASSSLAEVHSFLK
jgi:hypothetical protein